MATSTPYQAMRGFLGEEQQQVFDGADPTVVRDLPRSLNYNINRDGSDGYGFDVEFNFLPKNIVKCTIRIIEIDDSPYADTYPHVSLTLVEGVSMSRDMAKKLASKLQGVFGASGSSVPMSYLSEDLLRRLEIEHENIMKMGS